jgi:hypothetical protein
VTTTSTSTSTIPTAPHVGELKLRRFRIGELSGEAHDEIARHTAACAACKARLEALAVEQAAFAAAIPFERFAGGVERAARVPRARGRLGVLARPRWLAAGGAVFAAAAALVLVLGPRGGQVEDGGVSTTAGGYNGIKGGTSAARAASLRIGRVDGAGAQRPVAPGATTQLAAGEHLRVGYETPADAHLAVLSVDDQGVVTPIYPEAGASLPVATTRAMTYLPEAVELTGAGRERLFLLLGARAFSVDAARDAVRASYQAARGELGAMRLPALPGTSVTGFTWLLGKP